MLADRSSRPRLAELASREALAADNLRFIRETMERSSAFTAVPGWWTVAVGCSAIVAAVVASTRGDHLAWLGTWLAEAVIGFLCLGWATVRKARAEGIPILTGAGRKYTLGLLPPMVAAALLTLGLARAGVWSVLPALWLMLFGAGIITAGAFSIRVVPLMGLVLMIVGAVALFLPVGTGDLYMGIGFGGMFIIFGAVIARGNGS